MSYSGVAASLARLNRWQIRQTIQIASEDAEDGISGSTMLALMVKETNCRNIVGGGYFDDQDVWHETGVDRGVLQINEGYHRDFLSRIPGCRSGQWRPEDGRLAIERGYVPQLTPAVAYVCALRAASVQFAIRNGVRSGERVRFAIAAHNAGNGGALQGYRSGDVDRYTTLGNYSEVVLEIRGHVQRWLSEKGFVE